MQKRLRTNGFKEKGTVNQENGKHRISVTVETAEYLEERGWCLR